MTSTITISKPSRFRKLKQLDYYNIFLNIVLYLIITATMLLIINPTRYIDSINAGINLFFISVFPSLFPFLFLSKLLDGLGAFSKTNKIFRPITSKLFNAPEIASFPLLMTLFSGYPIGAKIVGDLKANNLINTDEAKLTICISSTSGPIFVIGSVGAGMLNNTRLGVLIFLCHILGTFFTAFLFTRKKSKHKTPPNQLSNQKTTSLLQSATSSTISAILTVAVYVSIFYMFIDMAYDLKILGIGAKIMEKLLNILSINPELAPGITSGLLEMTRGCKEIIAVGSEFYSLIFCSAIISFSGLSIILQSLTFLSSTGIKPAYFILFKTCQMVITLLTAIPIGLIFL